MIRLDPKNIYYSTHREIINIRTLTRKTMKKQQQKWKHFWAFQFNKIKMKNNKKENQRIAQERISGLFKQASLIFKEDSKLSNRYMNLARKISLKHKTPFSKEQKIQFCKKCQSFLVPGNNARIRTNKGKLVVLCLNCKHISRYKYK